MKRIIDLLVSLFLLTILFPVLIIVGVIVRLNMGSPILFKQQRPGLHERSFYLLKFRTMIDLRDEKGRFLPDHLRLTSFGQFLRRYSLDELPQLMNVVRGEMSLVGPRPLLMEYLSLYTNEQRSRHFVKPGMTGWAQINGRNAISWDERFVLDKWYVENQSLWLDLKILVATSLKVIRKDGITQNNHSSMEKFTGSSDMR